MKIVTGFDSQFEEAEAPKAPDSAQYKQIFDALEHNHEVAENAFARIAKTHFRSIVDGEVSRKSGDDAKGTWPAWFSETSCTVDTARQGAEESSVHLTELVDGFAKYLLSAVVHDEPADQRCLVESLSTRIVRIGETLYNFRIKQRWGVNE